MAGLTLAIETATAACSAALIEGGQILHRAHALVGRGHAERLMPMVEALLAGAGTARPESVLVGCGPGSFTGVRVGLAAAIGLGLGWGVPVHGMSSTALIAVAAGEPCTVALAGGHGELFVERFAHPLASCGPLLSLPPVQAAAATPDRLVIGSGAAALVAARGWGEAREALPDASDAARLPASFLLPPRPIYGRAPDAKPAAA